MILPAKVLETLLRMRKEHRHYVDVKVINGRCYVYESTSMWDRQDRRVVKKARYLGKITADGTFVPSVPRRPGESAALAGVASGRRGARTGVHYARRPIEYRERMGKYDRQILSLLSMDGRKTVSELAKEIGIKNTAMEWQKERVERRYGIRYVAETDISKLGYLTYIVLIKFESRKPGINEVRRELEKEPSVQLAMLTYGRYDLIMYMVMSRYEDIKVHFFNIRSRIFPSYDMKLYVVPFYLDYSFVPLRDKFVETLGDRVWSRSSEKPRPVEGDLLKREYAVLRALNSDGRRDFASIDSEYGLRAGSARYTYHKFIEEGVIKRITVSMREVHVNYISAIVLQKINHLKFAGHRKDLLQHIISDGDEAIMNRYALVGDIKMPEGVLLIMPVRSEREVMDADEQLRRIGGAEVDSLIVTNVIVGSLCYRNFDNRQSSQYRILRDEYRVADL